MNPVSKFPARKFGSAKIRRCSGIVVWIASSETFPGRDSCARWLRCDLCRERLASRSANHNKEESFPRHRRRYRPVRRCLREDPPGGTGVRIDTAAYAEGTIPPYYDSLIAKLVVRGKDRSEAISRMSRALGMFIVEGIHTTIPLHRRIFSDPDFRAGNFDTGFIERFLAKKESAS